WGQLLRYLAYKAEEAGRQLIAVDPRNTSRTCPVCGPCDNDNRPSQAEFRCQACGHQAHADINAAINILRAGQAQRQQREAHQQPA
ncbi:MAG: RNA-guided endonuclease InsQ/TnpB family protein, partial [Acidimicrobiales bacterium]